MNHGKNVGFNFFQVRCTHKSGDVVNFTTVACRISSQLKRYKNYKNRLKLAEVIVKNKLPRFLWLTVYITMWWSGSAHRQQNVDGNTNNIDASWNVRNWKCLLMSTKRPIVGMFNSTVAPTSIPGDEVIPIRKSTIYIWSRYIGMMVFICTTLASVGITCCCVSVCLSACHKSVFYWNG